PFLKPESPKPNPAPDDETALASRLIKRFRELSEARGVARAHGLFLEPTLADELDRLELRLVSELAHANHSAPPIAEVSVPSEAPASAPELAAAELPATIFTDGAAEGNPGPGGYCALIRMPGRPDRELSGGAR